MFGVSAIFYSGAAKVFLFLLGCFFGAVIFRSVLDVFFRAYASYPEHAKSYLIGLAVLYFAAWTAFREQIA